VPGWSSPRLSIPSRASLFFRSRMRGPHVRFCEGAAARLSSERHPTRSSFHPHRDKAHLSVGDGLLHLPLQRGEPSPAAFHVDQYDFVDVACMVTRKHHEVDDAAQKPHVPRMERKARQKGRELLADLPLEYRPAALDGLLRLFPQGPPHPQAPGDFPYEQQQHETADDPRVNPFHITSHPAFHHAAARPSLPTRRETDTEPSGQRCILPGCRAMPASSPPRRRRVRRRGEVVLGVVWHHFVSYRVLMEGCGHGPYCWPGASFGRRSAL